jgi:hypothetical protein
MQEICTRYNIINYVINGDVVDVNGDVSLSFGNLTELPLKFGIVTGNFDCSHNNITSLIGAPTHVSKNFYCDR